MVRRIGLVSGVLAVLFLAGCGQQAPQSPAKPGIAPPATSASPVAPPSTSQPAKTGKTLKIALIAKSQSNPVFQAARKGAMDAAEELAPQKYGVACEVLWQTPVDEDAQEQANKVEQLTQQGVDGIAISVSEAGKVTPAVKFAVEQRGVKVLCFDSDAPESGRFAYHGIDDIQCGKRVMSELAAQMNGQGKVAILAGNQTAPNLQKRTQGVREEAAQYPGITIVDTYYHKETPQDAAAKVEQVMQANPDITGWAMIGGWALFTSNALKWEPGTVKCVSVDALPAELSYLRSGHVQVLLAQRVYEWGYRSVDLLLDNILNGNVPPNGMDISELDRVTKDNVDEYAKNWEKWKP